MVSLGIKACCSLSLGTAGKIRDGGGRRQPRPGDLSVFYAGGAIIGWTPAQVREMTLPEFHAALDGYMQAHSAKPDTDLTEDDFTKALAEEMAAGRA